MKISLVLPKYEATTHSRTDLKVASSKAGQCCMAFCWLNYFCIFIRSFITYCTRFLLICIAECRLYALAYLLHRNTLLFNYYSFYRFSRRHKYRVKLPETKIALSIIEWMLYARSLSSQKITQ